MQTTVVEHTQLLKALHIDVQPFSIADRIKQHMLPHEFDSLLSALRRDMHHELGLAEQGGDWAAYHKHEARNSLHLLEMLNPKHPQI